MIDLRYDGPNLNIPVPNIKVSNSLNTIADRLKIIETEQKALEIEATGLEKQLETEREHVTFNVGDMFTVSVNGTLEHDVVIMRKYTTIENRGYRDELVDVEKVKYIYAHKTKDGNKQIETENVTEKYLRSRVKRFNGNINIYKILKLTKE